VAEETIYRDSAIQVTTSRAILRDKTYAMANVTSVSMYTQPGNRTAGIILSILGGFGVLVGLTAGPDARCALWFGAIMLAVGLLAAITPKNSYWVRIGSASGEANALSSPDPEYIRKIVEAMNDAIVRRG
jgi:hypothetical protein